jgi:hypothetical protein
VLGLLSYIFMSINPFGGLFISVPFAVFQLKYPVWLIFLSAVPCSYVQVVLVDLGWNQLNRSARFRAVLERKRSARIERLVASGGAFWPTVMLAPFIGPWVVMAFMRYSGVRQRRVCLPILLSMSVVAIATLAICLYAPHLYFEVRSGVTSVGPVR